MPIHGQATHCHAARADSVRGVRRSISPVACLVLSKRTGARQPAMRVLAVDRHSRRGTKWHDDRGGVRALCWGRVCSSIFAFLPAGWTPAAGTRVIRPRSSGLCPSSTPGTPVPLQTITPQPARSAARSTPPPRTSCTGTPRNVTRWSRSARAARPMTRSSTFSKDPARPRRAREPPSPAAMMIASEPKAGPGLHTSTSCPCARGSPTTSWSTGSRPSAGSIGWPSRRRSAPQGCRHSRRHSNPGPA